MAGFFLSAEGMFICFPSSASSPCKLSIKSTECVILNIMRIKTLDLTNIGPSVGLRASKPMGSLGQLVVLAGPNGAGKTRILNLIKAELSDVERSPGNFKNVLDSLSRCEKLKEKNGADQNLEQQISVYKTKINHINAIELDGEYRFGLVHDFFPKAVNLTSHQEFNEKNQIGMTKEIVEQIGINYLEQRAPSYLAVVERRAFAATHPDLTVDPEKRESAISEQKSLRKLIHDVLGIEPDLDINQQPTLFGRPLSEANLSEGQRLLFQVAILLHTQVKRIDGLILILDEPECHLHPIAAIQAIQRLRDSNPNGQIWLATHSVPVLAAMPPESIWYVNDGCVSWAGRCPEIVLESLLGGKEGRARMDEFLRLPAQFASNRFAAECLIPPKAVDTGVDDPQATQLRALIWNEARVEGAPLKILDYGAGQGRILSAMHESWQNPEQFVKRIDYRAFEPYPDDSGQLQRRLDTIYSGDLKRYFALKEDDLALIDPQSVDIVVMCNVLHEIPPTRWRALFGDAGTITRLLKSGGKLLILEDTEMPRGEKAHRFGFILLDHQHLFRLMDCDETDEKIETVEALEGRLKAHVVPASIIGRTTEKTTREALMLLKTTAKRTIHGLRKQAPESRNGRLHALWTQLLANAELALEPEE